MKKEEILLAFQQGRLSIGETRDALQRMKHGSGPFPISAMQTGMWALQKSSPMMTAYNVPVALRVSGSVNPERLKEACADLSRQFPILTSVVEGQDGVPRRSQSASRPVSFVAEEIGDVDEERLEALLRSIKDAPFDLDAGPLWRVHLLTRRADEHVLFIVIHHLIYDGTSALPLAEALLRFHAARVAGRSPDVRPEPDVDEEFVREEQRLVAGEKGREDLAYWAEQLSGQLPVLELPADRPRPTEQTYRGRVHTQTLSDDFVRLLKSFAATHDANRSAVLLAVFKLLLYRYSGQDDLIVGVPATGRLQRRFEKVVGNFVNMMPLRSRLDGRETFATLLRRVQATLDGGRDHAGYPFPLLVKHLNVPRMPALSPVFQAVFAYQNFIDAQGELALREEYGAEFLNVIHQEGEAEIELEVFERPDRIELNLKYNPDLFDRATVARMSERFVHLARQVLTDGDVPLDSYQLVTPSERQTVLYDWNRTQADYPRELCLHEWFEQQARRTPEAVAVVYEGESLSYAELDRRSGRLALYLQEQGVEPDSLVGVLMERSLDLMVALLGVMKSGAAYVPMEPEYPAERLGHIIEDSRVPLILTHSTLRPKIRAAAARRDLSLLAIDEQWQEVEQAAQVRRELSREVRPQHLVYVIYTSGSTGRPKGVMVPHRALTNLLWSMAETHGSTAGDRMLALATYAFDMSVPELYLPFVRGAQCILCDGDKAKDPHRLMEEIRRYRPTVMQATPTTCSMLFAAGWENRERVVILCGAEALPEPLKRQFVERGCTVWNMYGPTETTVWSTTKLVREGEPISVGRPLANTQVYILDAQQQPVPVGLPGELCIAGDGVARGYLGRPELTAEKFIDNPFAAGGKLYRTGDVARWLPDGCIELLGRNDYQVKLKGFRIELEEIENRLKQHEAVRDAVAVVNEQGGIKRLVAYYVAESASAHGPRELREHLLASLPAYMVPSFLIQLEQVPLTPNGKVDRKALMARPLELPEVPTSLLPESETEAAVLDIWKHVLKLDQLGVEEGFFDAGGDSVLAVVLAEQLARQMSVPFPVATLFKYSNVRDISNYIDAARQQQAAAQAATASTPTRRSVSGEGTDAETDAVAIIGISLNFPGAKDARQFWANLRAGVESVRRMTREELSALGVERRLLDSPNFIAVQSSADGKELFDPEFFGISTRDAELMDPQARQLLQHAWKAVEDAGYRPGQIPDTSVFVSASHSLYRAMTASGAETSPRPYVMEEPEEYVSWILAQGGTIPTLISHKLGLRGPSAYVHTNCSSSLTALNSAWQSIMTGESKYALVGAATLFPSSSAGYLHQPGLNFSSDGHLKAFDAEADGMIPGEGVAVVLVKRASDALADGDHVYALVRGIALNNDGADKVGFYAPSVRGQADVIEKVLHRTGIDPETIIYVEAHGTGTRLGDPVEVAALREVYERRTSRKQFCGLGSVKTNIGHLDTAAGLAGLIKVALSLQHDELPPTLHYHRQNPELKLEDSPFYVVDRLTPIETGARPARAALSSFGVGGTNAHALLERYAAAPVPQAPQTTREPHLIPLSAKTADRLAARVRALDQFLSSRNEALPQFRDLAFTLQMGREPMESRAAFMASSIEELQEHLHAFLESAGVGDASVASGARALHAGEAHAAAVRRGLNEAQLKELAGRWVSGETLDWTPLYESLPARRVSLPTYEFAEEAFGPRPRSGAATPSASDAKLHPLLHENVSSLAQARFKATFSGREFFLSDHRVRNQPVLPGVAYLEMVREAVSRALSIEDEAGWKVMLLNVVWVRPVVLTRGPVEIEVLLTRVDDAMLAFEVVSLDPDAAGAAPTLHCQGHALAGAAAERPTLDLEKLRTECGRLLLDAGRCYEIYERFGLSYGPAHKGVRSVYTCGGGAVLARLEIPPVVADSLTQFVLHPSLLDSAFQATIGLAILATEASELPAQPPLPFALHSLEVFAPCEGVMWAHIRPAPGQTGARAVEKIDIDLCDEEGRVCVRVSELTARLLSEPATGQGQFAPVIFEPHWQRRPSVAPSGATQAVQRELLLCGLEERSAAALAERFKGACTLLYSAQTDAAERYLGYSLQLFERLKGLMTASPTRPVFVQLLLVGDHSATGAAGLVSMLRTARLENPSVVGQCIELPAGVSQDEIIRALDDNLGRPEEPHVRGVSEQREVETLRECVDWLADALSPWRDGGTYLITGGAGQIAQLLAVEIAARVRGARLILVGRATSPSQSRWQAVREAGAEVEYRQADVADAEQVASLFDYVASRYERLNGIVHCAGIISDNFILKKQSAEFAQVYAAKVNGTLNLDRASRAYALDLFILFSSASAYLGNAGQADYSCANAFMDNFAKQRSRLVAEGQRSGRTLSIGWPLWEEGGMSPDPTSTQELRRRLGMVPLPTATAMSVLYAALESGRENVLATYGEPEKLRAVLAAAADHGDGPHARTSSDDEVGTDGEHMTPHSTEELAAAGRAQEALLREKTEHYLKRLLSSVLRTPVSRIDAQAPLEKYGIDSILVVSLNNELEKHFGSLSKTLFFEYQTVGELVGYFVEHHRAALLGLFDLERQKTGDARPQPPAPPTPPPTRRARAEVVGTVRAPASTAAQDIAIIGLAGRYPGANSVAEFWANLRDGKDSITEIPAERWDHSRYFHPDKEHPGTTYTKWGGFIDGVDRFDPTFFQISPREAAILDPQERLFLETAYEAMEDAGYTRQELSRAQGGLSGNVGVYVGVMYQEYQLYGAQATALGIPTALPSSPSSIANRVSYFCDFRGPSMGVDTMCSSSLTAIHLACQSLRLGECAVAIAGGVNVSIHPNKYLLLSFGRFASTKGRCESFGAGGDGYVPGEGVGAVLLKPLAQAEADGDHIYGVVKGSAVNHGGKTNGFSVPNPNAQSDVIAQAFRGAGVHPRTVSYLEAHGTGTSLGDPVEIAGLSKSFAQSTNERQFCPIGSVKSNIGHCESAAGVAALTKVLMQMKHRRLVPSLHSEVLNPNIDFERSPFYVQRRLTEWPRPTVMLDGREREYPRIAGISSFGAGGSNAHLIIEEYEASAPAHATPAPARVCIVLSAQTETQLRQQAERLLAHLDAEACDDRQLSSIAYTLQAGREAMGHRLAVAVGSVQELKTALEQFLSGEADQQHEFYAGVVSQQDKSLAALAQDEEFQGAVEKWGRGGKLNRIMQLWVRGFDVDWRLLYPDALPARMSLPTYPFNRRRYWGVPDLTTDAAPSPAAKVDAAAGDARIQARAKETQQVVLPALQARQASPTAEIPKPAGQIILALTPEVVSAPEASAPAPLPPAASVASSGAQVAPSRESVAALTTFLASSLADALMLMREEIDLDKPFVELGLDSIVGVEWVNAVNKQFGTALPATIVYDHPSLRQFAGFLRHERQSTAEEAGVVAAPLPAAPESRRVAREKPKAIALLPLPAAASGLEAARGEVHTSAGVRAGVQESALPARTATPAAETQAGRPLDTLITNLRASLAEALYLPVEEIDPDKPFVELGLDSIVGVEWVNAVNRHYGTALPATSVYDHPNVRQFAQFIASQLRDLPPRVVSEQRTRPPSLTTEELLRKVERGELDIEMADALLQEIEDSVELQTVENSA